jgi:hypothetical protein
MAAAGAADAAGMAAAGTVTIDSARLKNKKSPAIF